MLSCIVAIDKNYSIGKNNSLPWKLSDDLKLFKKITLHHSIIMGRKTFDSIGKALPDRHNIILSRKKDFYIKNCTVIRAFSTLQSLQKEPAESFIIGGSEIYQKTFHLCQKLYLTRVNATIMGADKVFPRIDFSKWKKTSSHNYKKSEKNEFNFNFSIWEKKLH